MSINILSTGSFVPPLSLTNDELCQRIDIDSSDEWIIQRVGVKERRISESLFNWEMGTKAAEHALEQAGLSASDIDFIVCATVSSEDSSPCTAAMIQRALGAQCPAMDLHAACSGFIYSLETCAALLKMGYKKILLVASERLSRIVDWSDRNTCVIFGDGAAALVLEEGDNYLASVLHSFGGDEVIKIPNFEGDRTFFTRDTPAPYIYMNGQETFKFAVGRMQKDIREVLGRANVREEDVSWVIPHQANIRIIDAARRRLHIDPDRYVTNIDRFGNTSAASIPLALDELNRSGKLKREDILVFCAFGGGLSSGASLLRW